MSTSETLMAPWGPFVNTVRQALQGCLFLDLKGLKRTLTLSLSPARYFSHVVTEEGKVLHKTFAEASFSTNILECSDIFHMLEKFSLPFISISLLLPTTDFCLLII